VTRILSGPDALEDAAALLARHEVLGVPTDTVYGLAAALAPAAIDALFEAKGRPAAVPVAVLCASADDAASLTTLGPAATALAAAFWPGPLTIVVDADPSLAALVRSPRGVGLRVPDDGRCRALLARTGPLAVTSANLHGEPPATTAAALLAALDGRIAAVLDDGPRDGVVSTVVDVIGTPQVLRSGALAPDQVLGALS
jgi:tRNA threonylcarbamoyl adenosine modification protein (Sua5/YciO/YrdC/YwlC family)